MSTWEETQERLRLARLPKPKKEKKPLRKVGLKLAEKKKAEKEMRGEDDTFKEKWFKARRKELTGTCQCGCTQPSSKNDDINFRSSCCHVFPQRLFQSIALHPLNCVERAIWATKKGSSCHTNMDNQSMDKWPQFADWEDIKARFNELSPMLTDEERANKFYTHLEKLVYTN